MALVERRDQDGIAILSLNRPEALNALSPSLFVELREHVEKIAEHCATRDREQRAGGDWAACLPQLAVEL